MRQELVLLAMILLLVILEIFMSNKKALVNMAIAFFTIHTLIGFIPLEDGSLFGGMFHTTQLIHLFKNVLNVGVLIILLNFLVDLIYGWLNPKIRYDEER